MLSFDTIEQYSHTLLNRLVGRLQAFEEPSLKSRDAGLAETKIDRPIERPVCGGFNEAYVMHHWANFGPVPPGRE